jgi:hypothetical protein
MVDMLNGKKSLLVIVLFAQIYKGIDVFSMVSFRGRYVLIVGERGCGVETWVC